MDVAAISNTTWKPPVLSRIDSHYNCTAAMIWNSQTLQSSSAEESVSYITDYLRSALADNVEKIDTDAPPPTVGQLLQWYLVSEITSDYETNNMFYWMRAGLYECESYNWTKEERKRICKTFGTSGNSDLTGVGMSIAYLMEAILATFYTPVLAYWSLKPESSDLPPSRRLRRVAVAFRESSYMFTDAAVMFSIALQVASLAQSAQNLNARPGIVMTHYTRRQSLSACLFSAHCAALLQLYITETRRQKQRLFSWLILVALVIANLTTLGIIEHSMEAERWSLTGPKTPSQLWSSECFDSAASPGPPMFLLYAGLVSLVLTVGSMCAERYIRNPSWRHKIRDRKLVYIPIQLGAVWFLFACIWMERSTVISITSPENSEDQKWTFGQVLSLATWIPIIKEWLFIYFYGPSEAFEGNITSRYSVTPTPQLAEDDEETEDDGETQSQRGSGSNTTDCFIRKLDRFIERKAKPSSNKLLQIQQPEFETNGEDAELVTG